MLFKIPPNIIDIMKVQVCTFMIALRLASP